MCLSCLHEALELLLSDSKVCCFFPKIATGEILKKGFGETLGECAVRCEGERKSLLVWKNKKNPFVCQVSEILSKLLCHCFSAHCSCMHAASISSIVLSATLKLQSPPETSSILLVQKERRNLNTHISHKAEPFPISRKMQ